MAENNKFTQVGVGKLTLTLASSPLDFSNQITAATIKPSVSEGEKLRFLSGDVSGGVTSYEYSVDVSFPQNLTDTGLAGFLWKNRGKTAKLSYTPNTADGFKFDINVRLDPPETGGDVGDASVQNHTFKGIGEPEVTNASKAGGLS